MLQEAMLLRGLHNFHLKCLCGRRPAHTRHTSAGSYMSGEEAGSSCVYPNSRPVVLFDVMDTICYDPFYQEMPRFFNMTFKELLDSKHPTAWIEFERALICENELFSKFFLDGRSFDGQALVNHMVNSYDYVDGMEFLLQRLHAAGYELHTMSNYPIWYKHIEKKLRLTRYLHWTFVSCEGAMKGHRKPDPESFRVVIDFLQLSPTTIIFIDDRKANVDAARAFGLQAIHFHDAVQLEAQLIQHGIQLSQC